MRRVQALLPAIVILGGFLFISPISAKVLISKIQVSGVSTTDEFIELYNYASSSANLTNWSLTKQTAGGTQSKLISSFPSSAIISPFSYFLVAHRDYSPINSVLSDLSYSNASYSLAANNSLLLANSDGEMIDEVSWGSVSTTIGSPTPNPESSKSLVRLPNDVTGNYLDTDNRLNDFTELDSQPFNLTSPSRPFFEISDPSQLTTPETPTSSSAENIITTTTTDWSVLRLNEIMPNPTDGDEWVEIYNPSLNEINLDGGTLCDNRASDTCTILNLNGIISGQTWKTFLLSGSKLNNDGDTVILKNAAGEIIDEIKYSETNIPAKGNSLARSISGGGVWEISTTPTQNFENIITLPFLPTTILSTGGSNGSYLWNAPLLNIKKTSPSTTQIDKIFLLWNVSYPKNIYINSTTLFSSNLSADPRGGEIMYSWNFGDGTSSDGSMVYHAFTSSGIFTVTIHGTSTQGTIGTKTLNIKVNNNLANNNAVYISSVSPRPDSENDEWISIEGFATSAVDLGNWKIGTENEKWYSLPIKTVLKPFGILKFYKSVTKLALNNAGGSVLLANSLGEIVDILNFGKGKIGEVYTHDATDIVSSTFFTSVAPEVKTTSTFGSNKYYSNLVLADARSLPIKSKTTLTGTVVSLPNHPYVNYFYINDESGGMQIYSYKKSFPILKLGDQIKVYGEISSLQGRPRLRISSASAITKLPSKIILQPEQKNIIDVDENDFGRLLSLTGEITDLNNASFFLDDTSAEAKVNLPLKSNINKKDLSLKTKIRVTGIVEQSASGWNITPRTSEDISQLDVDQKPISATTPTTKVAVGTGGGLFLVGLAAAIKKWILKK